MQWSAAAAGQASMRNERNARQFRRKWRQLAADPFHVDRVELAVVVLRNKGDVLVVQVVTIRHRRGIEWNLFAFRVDTVSGEVHAGLKRWIATEQIVGRAILLKDDDDVLEWSGLTES